MLYMYRSKSTVPVNPPINSYDTYKKLTRKYCISQSVSDDSGSGGMVETLPSRW